MHQTFCAFQVPQALGVVLAEGIHNHHAVDQRVDDRPQANTRLEASPARAEEQEQPGDETQVRDLGRTGPAQKRLVAHWHVCKIAYIQMKLMCGNGGCTPHHALASVAHSNSSRKPVLLSVTSYTVMLSAAKVVKSRIGALGGFIKRPIDPPGICNLDNAQRQGTSVSR